MQPNPSQRLLPHQAPPHGLARTHLPARHVFGVGGWVWDAQSSAWQGTSSAQIPPVFPSCSSSPSAPHPERLWEPVPGQEGSVHLERETLPLFCPSARCSALPHLHFPIHKHLARMLWNVLGAVAGPVFISPASFLGALWDPSREELVLLPRWMLWSKNDHGLGLTGRICLSPTYRKRPGCLHPRYCSRCSSIRRSDPATDSARMLGLRPACAA